MEEQNKSHFWRFAAGLALLMALGLGIYYAIGWYEWRGVQNEAAANDRALQDMKELEAQYENDTYGGTTPEATLALFIDALKKGDIDLASKYFVVDEREAWLNNLRRIQEGGKLNSMIRDIGTAQRGQDIDKNGAIFSLANSSNEITAMIYLASGKNGVWKILEL